MQIFIAYKNNIIKKLKGDLPTSIFAWFTILISAVIITVTLIVFWYFALYSALHNSVSSMHNEATEYERIVDTEQLETVLDLFKKVDRLQ